MSSTPIRLFFVLPRPLFPLFVLLLLGLCLTPVQALRAAGTGDASLILERYRECLLAADPVASEADFEPTPARMEEWIRTLDADGRWPDIAYADKDPAWWSAREHLLRLRVLALVSARAAAAPSALEQAGADADLERAIDRALEHWIKVRYQATNWWHNNIGAPQIMRDIVILRGERLVGVARAGALAVWKQYGTFKNPGGGQNTVWRSELAMDYGAITEDPMLIAEAAESIAGEIRVLPGGEGVQPDFSFHQHGPRLQQFHYGGFFVRDVSRIAWQLRGTPWAFSADKVALVTDVVLEASAWMVRATSTVPGTIDRQVSRPEGLSPGHGDLRVTARFLTEVATPERAEALRALIERQGGAGPALEGFRAFPDSDFATFHRPAFSFFLKTISTRSRPAESLNGENLRGRRLNSGDHYVLRDGMEYAGLPPVWDWELLPGVTGVAGAFSARPQAFVGSVGDGGSGATAMIYSVKTGDEKAGVTARKFWAASGDAVICLIADLQSGGSEPVRTALDQALLRGPVTVGAPDGSHRVVNEGEHAANPLSWIHHAGLAYLPLGEWPVSLRLGPATGTWKQINRGRGDEPVTRPVFLPVLEHGAATGGRSGGFAILAAATPDEAAERSARRSWEVLRNDAGAQALRFADGLVMAVFYEAGKIEVQGRAPFTASGPCLVLMREDVVFVADPARSGKEVVLEAGGRRAVVRPSMDGTTLRAVW